MKRLPKKLLLLILPLLFALLVLAISDISPASSADLAASHTSAPAENTVFGRVTSRSQEPVSGALVTAYRIQRLGRASTLTAADGSYQLALGPGLWAISVSPISTTVPGQWLYPGEPQEVEFPPSDQPQRYELNFTVAVADSTVKGRIALPDGTPPPFLVAVGLHNGEGIGRRVIADPISGEFKVSLPHGRYDIIIHPFHDGYLGPQLDPILLPPGETVDLGLIKLIPLDAALGGTVRDEQGRGVEGIPVAAWRDDRFDLVRTRTGPDGTYHLAVTAGRWHVQPAPGPDSGYLYLGGGETVRLGPGETVSGLDFEVLTADATIVGLLVSPAALTASDLDGWATAVNRADPRIHSGGPIESGRFAIHVPGGGYLVSAHLPPGSPYLSPERIAVNVESGETVTITIPLQKKDAAIVGALVDPRQNRNPVTGVWGMVTAWRDHQWTASHIRPDTGTYRLDVAAGIWRLNYRIADQEYVKLAGAANIPVESGQTVRWPLPITRRDAAIAGQVRSPDGQPVPGAMVIAQGLHGDVAALWLRTRADHRGHFRLSLPYGRYRVGAAGGQPGWINPVEWHVGVPPGGVVEGINLQFQQPNALVGGSLTVPDTQAEGDVLVWAWSDRGGFTKGRFPVSQTEPGGEATGLYRLGVMSGTTWHVGAIFETENAYWIGREVTEVDAPQVRLDLALTGPHPKPPPVVVTFDARRPQRLELADGTQIFIPAGAMPVEGMVTLRIVPLATLPHQRHARIIRYGYAFYAADESGRPIEEQFNHPVLIRFSYDDSDLGWREHRIKPAYFSTTTNQWTFPDNYAIDPLHNIVTMAIDHFTDFALVESPDQPAIFLPLIASQSLP